uniref:Structural maintenance of chromosomes protein n=1 Tax=Parastrongyloides trichosuri TaxID=131310 RepID=A0A0N4ZNR0_PARTI
MIKNKDASPSVENDENILLSEARKRKAPPNIVDSIVEEKRTKVEESDQIPGERNINDDAKSDDTIDLEKYKNLLKKNINDELVVDTKSEQKAGRLILSEVIFDNFKSYLGKKVLGEFDKNFTSIVGNNGSGKSNVIDGFLFVFDYSPRKIRMKKYCDLIHHSSQGSPDYASVEIHFKRIDNEAVVEEFNVKRSVNMDNKTYYEIDGQKCEKKFVKTFLKDHGLGLDHDRFLILQGEVENISLLKSKGEKEGEDGLLEYLDDIIGTSIYKKYIKELDEAIIELQKIITLKKRKVKDAQDYLDAINAKISNTIKSCRIMNAINDKRYVILNVEKRELHVKIEAAKNEYDKDIVEAKIMEQKKYDLAKEIARYKNKRRSLEEEFTKARDELFEVNSILSQLENELLSCKMKLKACEDESEDRQRENEKLTEEIQGLLEEPNKIRDCITKAKEELKALEQNTEELFLKKSEAENKFVLEREKYSNELESKEKIYRDQNADILTLKNIRNTKENSLELALSDHIKIKKKIEDIKNKIKHMEIENNNNLKELDEYRNKLNDIQREKNISNTNIKNIENNILDIDKDIASTKIELQKLTTEYGTMKGEESGDSKTQFLNKCGCKGFHGRLGDLAQIDSKYDIALSTLGGNQLNLYVVDTIEDGQYLVKKLKDNNRGIASFMAIDQISQSSNMNKKVNYPSGALRAFDLLTITDKAVTNCFYYVYRESLVVNSVKDFEPTKRALGKSFTKMCSLDGAISESSGKITGGGRPIKGQIGGKNTASRTFSESDKRNYEISIGNLNKKLVDLKNNYTNYTENLYNLKEKIRNCSFKEEEYIGKINSILQLIKTHPRRQKTLENELKYAQEDCRNIQIDEVNVENIKREIMEINNKMESHEEFLKESKKDYYKINSVVEKLRRDIVGTLENEYTNLLKEKEIKVNEIEKLNKQFSSSQSKCARKTKELKANDEYLNSLTNKKFELEEIIETHEDKVKELRKAREEWNDKYTRLGELMRSNHQLLELERRENEVAISLDDINLTINKVKDQIRQYKEQKKEVNVHLNAVKYVFFSEMAKLPSEVVEFNKEEPYYNERVEKAEKDFIASILNNEIMECTGFVKVSPEQLNIEFIDEVRLKEFQQFKDDLKILSDINKDPLDYEVISEYIQCSENRDLMGKIHKNYINVYESLKIKYDELIRKRYKKFQEGFEVISKNVKNVYRQITFGGDAELECIDIFDPYSSGILYSVRPPGKSWKKMTNLSGGEKTLSSLAFIFALHFFNPTPLYVMDEIDAALDFRNVGIIADYIRERTQNAQFIVISLRKELYEKCNKVLGIWKINDVSRCMVHFSNSYCSRKTLDPSSNDDFGGLLKKLKSLRDKK